jgi:hypothetical protein
VVLSSDKSKSSQHRQIAISSVETKIICMSDCYANYSCQLAGCGLEPSHSWSSKLVQPCMNSSSGSLLSRFFLYACRPQANSPAKQRKNCCPKPLLMEKSFAMPPLSFPFPESSRSLRSRSPPSYRRIERIQRNFQCALAPAGIRAFLGSCARWLVADFEYGITPPATR